MPYVNCEGPDEHAHPYSLIQTSSVRHLILKYTDSVTWQRRPCQLAQADQGLALSQIA